MATFSSVARQHVLQAIEEYDRRGGDDFLAVYGFVPQAEWTVQHEGRDYDLPAVVGVAHRFATGRLATPDDLNGSLSSAAAILRKRGFDVTQPGGGPVAAPVRAARAPQRRAPAAKPRRSSAEPERVAPVCPTCHMTLAGTGNCDYCA
ncbi:hypothetical protein H9657_05865 [Cellulomonas sp. Sa3CUA2]|uniref:ScoMcrA-like N-terminal head domain-containing protein n=1 Tax=Cellulomonas avistercoris TaxID=2762242 RepID=A0ABR8QBJ8_9CELL|nr:hypothetical protein [Cellulomonas avistercoris]MBD7917803.1 hypothetical protein [Cellulomonas avistercoris]